MNKENLLEQKASGNAGCFQRLVRRIALRVELALEYFSCMATDHAIAETDGSYEQHVENMKNHFERRENILKKYPPNRVLG